MTNILFAVNDYIARLLQAEDISAEQSLFERCTDYFELVEGHPTDSAAAQSLFMDLPPNKTYEDKFVLGIFDRADRLIGVIDVVRDYPDRAIWYIGLMLIDPDQRSHGLGSSVCRSLERWIEQSGGKHIRLSVFEQNRRAHKFWTSMGFSELNRHDRTFGVRHSIEILMHKDINHG